MDDDNRRSRISDLLNHGYEGDQTELRVLLEPEAQSECPTCGGCGYLNQCGDCSGHGYIIDGDTDERAKCGGCSGRGFLGRRKEKCEGCGGTGKRKGNGR